MAITELLSMGCCGAFLAVAVRWLLHLEVPIGWAACIGAVSASAHHSLGAPLGAAVTVCWLPQLFMSLAVTVAILGVAQVIRSS